MKTEYKVTANWQDGSGYAYIIEAPNASLAKEKLKQRFSPYGRTAKLTAKKIK